MNKPFLLIIFIALILSACQKTPGNAAINAQPTEAIIEKELDSTTNNLRVRIKKISDNGGRVSWYKGTSHQLIAYDAITNNLNKNTEVFVTDINEQKPECITCNNRTIKKGFTGNPDWHPNGEHLLIQAENANSNHTRFEHVSFGYNNDLWIVSRDGKEAYNIWRTPKDHAVLHPHFNKDGNKVVFAEGIVTGNKLPPLLRRLTPDGENQWEGWRIVILGLEFTPEQGYTITSTERMFTDRTGFFETHGFIDDNNILFTYTEGGKTCADNLYSARIGSNRMHQLVSDKKSWEEHAHYSPSGKTLAFMSSRNIGNFVACEQLPDELRTELFLKRNNRIMRITRLNENNERQAVVTDLDWNKTGNKIIFQVAPGFSENPELWLAEFNQNL